MHIALLEQFKQVRARRFGRDGMMESAAQNYT